MILSMFLLSFLLISLISITFAKDRNYYIDGLRGNDLNSGRNETDAWKSFRPLSEQFSSIANVCLLLL